MVNIKTSAANLETTSPGYQSNTASNSSAQNTSSHANTNINRQILTRSDSKPSSTSQTSNNKQTNLSHIEKKIFNSEKATNSNMSKHNFTTNNNYINQQHHHQHIQQQPQQHQGQYYSSNNSSTSYNNSNYQQQQTSKQHFNLNGHRFTNSNNSNGNSGFTIGQHQQHHPTHHRNNSISTMMSTNNNSSSSSSSSGGGSNSHINTTHSNSRYAGNNIHHQHQLHHHNSMQNIYLNNNFHGNNTNSNSNNYNNGYHSNTMGFNQTPSPLPSQSQQHHIYQKQISLPANMNISRQHHQNQQQHQNSPSQQVNNQQQYGINYSSTSSSSSIATHSPTSPTSSSSSINTSISSTKSNRPQPRLTDVKHNQLIPLLINEEKIVALPLLSPKIELEKIDETKALLLNTNENNENEDDYKEVLLNENDEDEVVFEEDEDEVVIKEDCEENGLSSACCLADLIPSERDFNGNKLDYFRHVIKAVDRLYPDTKWPLHNTWTFWHIKNDPNQSWEANIKEIVDVSYVEDFWSVANYLYTPMNMLSHGGDITFFKKSIRPMWEDVQNKAGGSWLHTIHQYKKYPEIYDYWLETLIALIGDNFCGAVAGRCEQTSSNYEHVCDFISGVYASPRSKQHKLALWTQNYKDEKTTRLIGKIWKKIMNINENITITFEAHETKYDKNANFKIVYKE